jgi:hypothetical protein
VRSEGYPHHLTRYAGLAYSRACHQQTSHGHPEGSRPSPREEYRMLKHHIAVRVDEQTVARIESLQRFFSTTWRDATTSDVMRAGVRAGLEIMEKAHTEELKKKRPKPASRRVSQPT